MSFQFQLFKDLLGACLPYYMTAIMFISANEFVHLSICMEFSCFHSFFYFYPYLYFILSASQYFFFFFLDRQKHYKADRMKYSASNCTYGIPYYINSRDKVTDLFFKLGLSVFWFPHVAHCPLFFCLEFLSFVTFSFACLTCLLLPNLYCGY